MNINGEAHAVFCHMRLDDYELRPVNQRTDNLVQQLTNANMRAES